jgi:hypothetical protein
MSTFQFKIQISGITKPPVWRRLTVPASYSFYDFHIAIQVAFGWYNSHLFEFSPKGFGSEPSIQQIFDDQMDFRDVEPIDADKIKLSKIFKKEKQKFTYIYDFGDSWEHSITLEKIFPGKTKLPVLLAGKGRCPQEDCGGIWGYAEIKEALKDPDHPEYEEYAEWLGMEEGETWDATAFNIETHQETMKRVFKKH